VISINNAVPRDRRRPGAERRQSRVYEATGWPRRAVTYASAGELLLGSCQAWTSGAQSATYPGGLTWNLVNERTAGSGLPNMAGTSDDPHQFYSDLASPARASPVAHVVSLSTGVGASTASAPPPVPQQWRSRRRSPCRCCMELATTRIRALARGGRVGTDEVHEWVDTGAADTNWVQALSNPWRRPARRVALVDNSPLTDQWNLVPWSRSRGDHFERARDESDGIVSVVTGRPTVPARAAFSMGSRRATEV